MPQLGSSQSQLGPGGRAGQGDPIWSLLPVERREKPSRKREQQQGSNPLGGKMPFSQIPSSNGIQCLKPPYSGSLRAVPFHILPDGRN